MSTPTLDLFLGEIGDILLSQDGAKLKDYLYIEPPLPDIYKKIALELRQRFSAASPANTKELIRKLESSLPAHDPDDDPKVGPTTGGTCDRINMFLASYLLFIRDVEQRDVSTIFKSFRLVIQHLSAALGDNELGANMVETVVAYCDMLAKFTRSLERNPELTASLIAEESIMRAESNTVTLTGLAVESIQPIFQKCATWVPKNGVFKFDRNNRIQGHRGAMLRLANICLPMCLKSGDLNSLDQLVTILDRSGLPLTNYSLPQRATYLYYLGRYWFAYNHFVRAQVALQQALDWTPARFQSQRTQILTFLLATSIIVGRFPSQRLLQSPEAASLRPHFEPLCNAIRHADLPKFRSLVNTRSTFPSDAATASWFLRRRLLFPLRHRCEVLVTRQIFYMYFMLTGAKGPEKGPPNFNLPELRDLMVRLEKRAELHIAKVSRPVAINGYDSDTPDEEEDEPSLLEVEATAASLITQGLMSGTVVHGLSKVQLKRDKILKHAGFPRVWDVTRRGDNPSRVPGWNRGN